MASTNGHHKVVGKLELITPEEAGNLLTRNKHNRRMSAHQARRLADTMISGGWRPDNGETVKISDDGHILDGQHRLAAVVMANMPVEMMVVRDVPRDAYETIDIGRPRRMADMLHVRGEKSNEKDLATALRVLYGYLMLGNFGPMPTYRNPTPTELFDLLKKNPKLRESLIWTRRVKGRMPNMPSSVMSVVHYTLAKIQAEEADAFFEELITGEGVEGAMLRFRDRMMNRYRGRLAPNDAAAILIKLWNGRRTNTIGAMQSVGFRPYGARPEQFPVPV